jgi:HlyD family secretion protein
MPSSGRPAAGTALVAAIGRARPRLPATRLSPPRARAPDPTLPALLEFQWPSTAVANAPVPRFARGVVWMVASMVATLILVAGLLPVDRVVTARAIVVSQTASIQVQPLETAIVRAIEVREGEEVKAGQVLARLDPTFAAADLDALATQVGALEALVARLQAEASGQAFAYAGLDPAWSLQAAIHAHRKAELDSKVENYNLRYAELTAAIARAQADASGYAARLKVAVDVETMRKKLEAQKWGSRLNTLAATDNRAEMERALANAQQSAEAARRDQAAVRAERDAFVQGWASETSQQLAEATAKLADARGALDKAKLRRRLVELKSEKDGIVQSVAKVSVGSVVQSGQSLITLVPSDAPLEIEADIAGRDNGFVHVGDPVAIKLDTFSFSQYGMAEGRVRTISPDSLTAQDEARNPTGALALQPGSIEPYFRARISIDKVALHGVPAGFRLRPGLPATADIKVGQRTVLGYLLGSVLPVAQEGMREP